MNKSWDIPHTIWTVESFLTADDLNRIEESINWLHNALKGLGYDIPNIEPILNRTQESVPTKSDLSRICGSIEKITNAYYRPKGYLSLQGIPEKNLHADDLENLEAYLRTLYHLLYIGRHYNTWRDLETHQYTYEYLSQKTYEQLQKGLNYPAFLYDETMDQNEEGD